MKSIKEMTDAELKRDNLDYFNAIESDCFGASDCKGQQITGMELARRGYEWDFERLKWFKVKG